MYPASEWRIALRALDDDPHVSVLLNPAVTRDAFECSGFPARRWTVRSSPSLLSVLKELFRVPVERVDLLGAGVAE
jgi:hypothetical protein